MRVTVTGGAGFIGSHLLEHLQLQGCQVQVIDDLSTGLRSRIPAGVEWLEACITSPQAAQAVSQFAPQLLIHLAAQIDLRLSLDMPAEDARINVAGTVAMLEAARLGGALKRMVLASSAAVYGLQQTHAAAESHSLAPLSAYGAAKLAAELYLGQFQRLHGLSTISLRFANVYGPGQSPKGEAGVISIFAKRLAAGKPLNIFGDGEATRDYLYVSDVVAGLWAAARHPEVLGAVNLGTGVQTSVNELVVALQSSAQKTTEVRHEDARLGEVAHSLLDAGLAHSSLGWKAQVPLSAGLLKTWSAMTTKG
jgi:UDP-glucose 4-epimerase